MNLPKPVRDAVCIVLITLALVTGSELLLRLFFTEKLNVHRTPASLAYEFNERYLVGLRPGIETTYVRSAGDGGQTIQWKTNADSFRGPELAEDPPARIIVYGDSNVQARFSQRENTFAFRLEQYLQAAGIPGLEVVNAGVVGFGPDQALIRMESEIDRYEPDLVIFQTCDNDFGEFVRNRLFDLSADGTLVPTPFPKEVDEQLNSTDGFPKRLMLFRAANKLARLLGLVAESGGVDYRIIRTRAGGFELFELRGQKEFEVYRDSRPKSVSHFADYYDLDIALNADTEAANTKRRMMAAALKRAKAVADEKGVAFLVLIEPSVIDFTHGSPYLDYEYLGANHPSYARSNLTSAVAHICEKAGIDHVNLFDAFDRDGDPTTLFFTGRNDHWNDRGQDLAARTTALHLQEARPELLAGWAARGH
jgi:hypothetical protein